MMERAMLEYLANALWQLPVLAAGAWALLWLMKPGPRTQYRVWVAVLGIAVLLPAWGIPSGKFVTVTGARFDELATARIVQRSDGVVAVDATAPLRVDSVPVSGEQTAKAMWGRQFFAFSRITGSVSSQNRVNFAMYCFGLVPGISV